MKLSRGKIENNAKESSVSSRNPAQRRRTRSRARASPGRGPLHNGLMNAAWPRSPKYPQAKPSGKSFSPLNQTWAEKDNISHLTDQVEDMEVDSHDNLVLLSSGAVTELSLMSNKNAALPKEKQISKQQGCKASSEAAITPDKLSKSKHGKTKEAESKRFTESKRESEAASSLSKDENTGVVAQSTKNENLSTLSAITPKSHHGAPVFIVLHVSRVDAGKLSGPATCPVKIYGERIMIQMQDKITSQEISYRIVCRNITDLKLNFKHRPFFLKMKVAKIQQVNKEIASTKNDDSSKVAFYLAYENEVPEDIYLGLKQLFKENLSDLHLWPENDSDEDNPCTDSATKESSPPARSEKELVTQSSSIVANQACSTRKRTPDTKNHQAKHLDILKDAKITRRSLSFERGSDEESIKSLEIEAARYQLLLGQKRLEIQCLEQQLSEKEADILSSREEALKAIEAKDNNINELHSSLEQLRILTNSEKEKNQANVKRIVSMQKIIDENRKVVEEHEQAILVRDNQLKEVRSTASSPRKIDESDYSEEIKRMGLSLQQLRSALDESRRSKINISEELRKTVNTIENLREQLRTKVIRNRKLETEKGSDVQKLADAVSSKRLIEIELNDERSRISSLERELFNSRRRAENEENRRLELEVDCQSLRTQIEQKSAVIEHVISERDTAVTELGLLKREFMNEQDNSEGNGPRSSENTGNDVNLPRNAEEIDDWVIDRNEIVLQDVVLGVGGWGNVKLGNFRGTPVAVKQIHHLILSSHNRRLFSREMRIASRCRHPCLLQFIGATCDDGAPLFVSEVLDTDLRTHLGQKPLSDKEISSIALDIALALNYLHKAQPTPIIHRDISSSNILLWYKGSDLHGKLSDYGAANFFRISMTRHPGAALYSAPETASRQQTTKVDIFSFGILLCEMLIRELPVTEQRAQQIRLIRSEGHRNIVQRCIEEDPSLRPSASELVDICRRWNRQFSS